MTLHAVACPSACPRHLLSATPPAGSFPVPRTQKRTRIYAEASRKLKQGDCAPALLGKLGRSTAALLMSAPLILVSPGTALASDLGQEARNTLARSLPDAAADSQPLSEYSKSKREGADNLPDIKAGLEDLADKATKGVAAAPTSSNPGQNVKDFVKSNTFSQDAPNSPSVRPPGLKDTAVGRTVPEKEATGAGPQTSSKY